MLYFAIIHIIPFIGKGDSITHFPDGIMEILDFKVS